MNHNDKLRVRKKVKEEFQLGRARLFSLKNEKKLRAEIFEDKERLFGLFKSQGLLKEQEFNESLARLLMNFSKMASYRGLREGFEISSYATELREDRARFYLFAFLQEHPEATNRELTLYLDNKNSRLEAIGKRPSDPLWAPLPPAWKKKFKERGLGYYTGDYWETALKEFPKLVMPYLSRVRKMAKETKAKNALFNWPEILKQHKKQRK